MSIEVWPCWYLCRFLLWVERLLTWEKCLFLLSISLNVSYIHIVNFILLYFDILFILLFLLSIFHGNALDPFYLSAQKVLEHLEKVA